MSTIVAVQKNGKAVIAADTLTRFDHVKQSKNQMDGGSKIMLAGENYIASVGDAVGDMVLEHYFGNQKKIPTWRNRIEIFDVFTSFHKALKEDYFLDPAEDDADFESSKFHWLVANKHGIFGVYALRSVDKFSKFFAFGSGYQFALGAMQAVYDTDMSAKEIAEVGINAAANFDDGTGLPTDLFEIDILL